MSGPGLPYWHIDAFADRPLTGNQAAVMLLEGWPQDALLAAIAAEHNFAETAFLVPAEGGAFSLRWFTPALEVALCGHATLAAGHAILGAAPDRAEVRFLTRRSGELVVRREGEGYALSLPALAPAGSPPAPLAGPALAAALGALPEELAWHPGGYLVCRFANEAQVRGLRPDCAALAAHGGVQFICTAPGQHHDVVSRVFVPGAGIDEDSVTGSAHAVLALFWAERLARRAFSAFQASRRGGALAVRLEGERAILAGRCFTIVEGRFYLSG